MSDGRSVRIPPVVITAFTGPIIFSFGWRRSPIFVVAAFTIAPDVSPNFLHRSLAQNRYSDRSHNFSPASWHFPLVHEHQLPQPWQLPSPDLGGLTFHSSSTGIPQ